MPAATVTGEVRLIDAARPSNRKKVDYSGVVVWLTLPGESGNHRANGHAQMLQKNKVFTPHVLAVETGTTVDFPNLDPIFHNAFSNFDGKIFDVALYPPGSTRAVRFDRPGIVRVFCNIHAFMSAIILVVNSSYFAITDRAGRYSFSKVPAGAYEIHYFHERAIPAVLQKLTNTIEVDGAGTNLAIVNISDAGYLPVAHKNKYGNDYPPGAERNSDYSLPLK